MDFDLAYEELEFNKVEEKIGVIFDDKKLLVKAFVHPSVCSEPNMNYQRLEFLGDAILQLVVSDYMYRFQTEKTEGDMSKERALLVSKNSLALIIKEEELHHFLMLGKSILTDTKNESKFRDSYVADVYESIVAAIYLDQGMEEAERFINDTLVTRMDYILNHDEFLDYKSKLQEILQKNGNINLRYETYPEDDGFGCNLYLEEVIIGNGYGTTKKKAEQVSAKNAINTMV